MTRSCAICRMLGSSKRRGGSPIDSSGLIRHPETSLIVLLLVGTIAGCGRNDIQVYRVAKEADSSASLPVGWREVPPGEMRVASFRVNGPNGKVADVGVSPLPGLAGTDLANVNRWRGQVGASPVTEDELPKLADTIQIAGQDAHLYEQAGTNP